jgi:type IV fimbrial biogenesis protein FimT
MRHITKKTLSGFSMLEFMVVVLIISILTSMAIPSYQFFRKNNQLISAANDFISALQFARAEAVRRGKIVRISANNAGDASNEYGPGLTVWFDSNGDGNLDSGEELSVVAKSQSGVSADSVDNLSTLTFNARGETDNPDVLHICDDRANETGREIKVLLTGLVTVGNYVCP